MMHWRLAAGMFEEELRLADAETLGKGSTALKSKGLVEHIAQRPLMTIGQAVGYD